MRSFVTTRHNLKRAGFASLLAAGLALSAPAHAWFFFLPLGLFAGKGDTCVKREAKVGDQTTRGDGNVGVITELSGTSYRCTNPDLPILAQLELRRMPANVTQAGMQLPEGWTQLPVTDVAKSVGVVSFMQNRTLGAWMEVVTFPRAGITDVSTFVGAKKASQLSRLKEPEVMQTTQLRVGGLPAWRYELRGRIPNGTDVRYTVTFVEGDTEIVFLNAWTAAAGFDSARQHLVAIADSVNGIGKPPAPVAPSADSPSALPQAALLAPGPTPAPAQQLQANSSTQAPALTSPQTSAPSSQAGQRLRELNSLFKDGVINQQEFDEKRKTLLETL